MPRTLALSLIAAAAGVALAAVLAFAGPAARTSADPNLDSEEQTFVTLINNYRAQNGLGPLSIDWEMQASADWMSTDMGINGYFDHYDHCTGDCVNGHQYSASVSRSPWTRMCTFGYCYNTWMAENIAAGYSTAQGVFTAWQNSPGHNANMLGAHYIAMGIARVYVPGSPYGWYWTNDFGGVQSNAAGPAGGNGATNTPSSTPSPAPTSTPSPAPTATPSPTPAPTSAPANDPDGDGFSTASELFMGTDPARACGINAWPPDLNNDGATDLTDVMMLVQAFMSRTYTPRYDLNTDGYITLSDIFILVGKLNKSCSP